jgi:hypothetical protein
LWRDAPRGLAQNPNRPRRPSRFPQNSAIWQIWHGVCNVPGIDGDQRRNRPKGIKTMFLRIESAQRTAFSIIAAVAFAAVAISAAVPVSPIA